MKKLVFMSLCIMFLLTSCITVIIPASPEASPQVTAQSPRPTESKAEGADGLFAGIDVHLYQDGELEFGVFYGESFAVEVPEDWVQSYVLGITLLAPENADVHSGLSVLRVEDFPLTQGDEAHAKSEAQSLLDELGTEDANITYCGWETFGENEILVIRTHSDTGQAQHTLYCLDHYGYLHILSCLDSAGALTQVFEAAAESFEVWDNRILY